MTTTTTTPATGRRLFITRPITVNLDSGAVVKLQAGVQTLDEALAQHWFVQANAQSFEESAPENAHELVAALQARLDTALQQLSASEASVQQLEKQAIASKKRIAELERQLQDKAPLAESKQGAKPGTA